MNLFKNIFPTLSIDFSERYQYAKKAWVSSDNDPLRAICYYDQFVYLTYFLFPPIIALEKGLR